MAMKQEINQGTKREQGHFLLKRLGKTKLRPGGIKATNWLFDQVEITKDSKVLEVACNEGENLINIASKYKCECFGIDTNADAIEKGIKEINEQSLEELICLQEGSALNLPFEDETFDIIINEAMLTMLSPNQKSAALSEYLRVLKKDGVLLTHDVMLTEENPNLVKELQKVINVPAQPLTENEWLNLFKFSGYENITFSKGEMSLLSKEGLMKDEGKEGMLEILKNVMSDSNRGQFFEMVDFFTKYRKSCYYIAIKSEKL